MMHRTNKGARVECQLPGPRTWYVVDEWDDPRGRGEGLDGKAYALQSLGIDGGPMLDVVAVRSVNSGNYRIVKY
jgi:hypothetical protein